MSNELKFTFGFDDNWDGMLVMQCPRCGEITQEKLATLDAGKKLSCGCGFTVTLQGKDLKGAEENLATMRNALKSLGM